MAIAKPANLFTVFRLVAHIRHSPVPGVRDLDSLLRAKHCNRAASDCHTALFRRLSAARHSAGPATPPDSASLEHRHALPACPTGQRALLSKLEKLQAELRSTPFYWHPDVLGGPKGL